jgi:hypothetical protein
MSLEEKLSKAIFQNRVHDISDMIRNGLTLNRLLKYPVGCQYLTLNHGEMNLSGNSHIFVNKRLLSSIYWRRNKWSVLGKL